MSQSPAGGLSVVKGVCDASFHSVLNIPFTKIGGKAAVAGGVVHS